jgi:hypothetical protein
MIWYAITQANAKPFCFNKKPDHPVIFCIKAALTIQLYKSATQRKPYGCTIAGLIIFYLIPLRLN